MSKSCSCLSQVCTCAKPLNDPGLTSLTFRASAYGKSRDRMFKLISQTAFPDPDLSDLSGETKLGAAPLGGLTTRSTGDISIAVIDSWAMACDVLSFYQERIINEGFLRTATERRSVLELAREIGYELSPGVAASAYLIYTVEDSPLSPRSLTVPKGSAVQSVPQKEEVPQTFEVAEDTPVRVSWNKLLPKQSEPQALAAGLATILFEGPLPEVHKGDYLLIQPEGGAKLEVRKVLQNTFAPKTNVTTIQLEPATSSVSGTIRTATSDNFAQSYADSDLFDLIDESTLQSQIVERGLDYEEIESVAKTSRMATLRPEPPVIPSELGNLPLGVYVFKYRTANFGHNAPPFETLPTSLRVFVRNSAGQPVDADGHIISPRFGYPSPPTGFDDVPITKQYDAAWKTGADFHLERSIPDLRAGEPVLIQNKDDLPLTFQIESVIEASVAEFTLSGKSTGLKVEGLGEADRTDLASFMLRLTTIFVGASSLQLAPMPVSDPIPRGETSILLDAMVTGLKVGKVLSLQGESVEHPGVTKTELIAVKRVTHERGLTTIELQAPLQNGYIRSTVQISANLVGANHGATVANEILGSGDGSKVHQSFTLKKKPLTYVSSADPSGSTSTLEVRVNNVLWAQVPSLYSSGPTDKVYCVRISDDGVVSVKFGDGKKGARLPTGSYNVFATYREGIGVAGVVPATTLSLPKRKPLGIRSIVNPLASGGGVDPESRDQARTNAPSTVLTMQRIVSRKDLEDMASAFGGVGKASAVEIRKSQTHILLLTVGSSEQGPLDLNSDTFKNLKKAVKLASEPSLRVEIATYSPKQFEVDADILVDPAYVVDDVITAAKAALTSTFGFATRCFSQPVSLAEVMAAIQKVAGVLMVDINVLDYSLATSTTAHSLLEARRVDWSPTGVTTAELLTINPFGIEIRGTKA